MIGCLTFALASTIAGVPNKILGKTDILALIRCSLFFFFFKVYIYSFYSFLFFCHKDTTEERRVWKE